MSMKKTILACILLITMCVSIAPAALAADGGTIAILPDMSVSDTSDPARFTVYQLTTGTASDINTVRGMANVSWGSGIDAAGFVADVKEEPLFADALAYIIDTYGSEEAAGDYAGAIAGIYKKEPGLNETLAAIAADHITEAYCSTTWDEQRAAWVFSIDAPGLYLILDTFEEPEDGVLDDRAMPYIVAARGGMELPITSYLPAISKTVNFAEKTAIDTGSESRCSATILLPADYEDYTTYHMTLHEQTADGIVIIPESVSVAVDGRVIDAGDDTYTVDEIDTDSGSAIDITFADMKNEAMGHVTSLSSISVTYTITVDRPMTPGEERACSSQLTYSSALDGTGSSKGPKTNAYVYTMGLDIITDPDSTFVLQNIEGRYAVVDDQENGCQVTGWVDDQADASSLQTPENGLLRVNGVSENVYTLRETDAPGGMATMPDITMSLVADKDVDGSIRGVSASLSEDSFALAEQGNSIADLALHLAHGENAMTAQAGDNDEQREEQTETLTDTPKIGSILFIAALVIAVVAIVVKKLFTYQKQNKH